MVQMRLPRSMVRLGRFAGLALLATALFGAGAFVRGAFVQEALAQGKVVNVYNWNDYIDPTVLEEFTKETGIKVVYDNYDNNEIVESKLLAGASGYDIVVPSAPFLERLIKAKIFLKLDKAKIPNIKHFWPDIAERMKVYDPGNAYAVTYMWGTTGIGINVAKVKERLGDLPLNSWDLAYKPEVVSKLADCGVHILDSPEDLLPSVLNYLGFKGSSKNQAEIQKAAEHIGKMRKSVRKFHSSEYINALAGGDICLAVGYSGDILQARRRAEEAKNGVEVAYVVPKEGAQMWFDSLAIPADAPHKDEAHAFIDFLMRPEIAARNSNLTRYANGNLASKSLIKPEIAGNASIYPDDATMKRLFTNTAYDDKLQKAVTRMWTKAKTGL